jgi:Protein of unknown function (DUF2845)
MQGATYKVWVPAVVLAGLLLFPEPAWAFRCGNKLVVDGDSADHVVSRCGEPEKKTSYIALRPPIIWYGSRPVRVPGDSIEVKVETWTYNFGPKKLMQQVRLEAGIVVDVQALGYGHP